MHVSQNGSWRPRWEQLVIFSWILLAAYPALAADHGDTPRLLMADRPDARLTDLFAFIRDDQLVIVLDTNPTIPPAVKAYTFPSDVDFSVMIDHDAEVSFPPDESIRFGGKITDSSRIQAEIVIDVSFTAADGRLQLTTQPESLVKRVVSWSGLRDDPFILPNRAGKNIAAIVLSMPLGAVRAPEQKTLLLWATSRVEMLPGGQHELAGRAIRSQEKGSLRFNEAPPAQHQIEPGEQADVMILDPSRPVRFPNGRELADDVVATVCVEFGECRLLLASFDQARVPRMTTNDMEFLDVFPFLAPPH